jgi:hypothetical protein
MNPDLLFFEPWMAAAGALVICLAIIHKRYFYKQPSRLRPFGRLMVPAVLHFVPACVATVFVVMSCFRLLTEAGHSVPSYVAQLVALFALYVISELLLRPEMDEIPKEPPRW